MFASFVLFIDSHSFVQSLLFCPQNLQTTFRELKPVCLIFSVHRILIWLACWVARAAFIVTVLKKNFAKHLCSSTVCPRSTGGIQFPTVVTFTAFVNSSVSCSSPSLNSLCGSALHYHSRRSSFMGAFRCSLNRREGFLNLTSRDHF